MFPPPHSSGERQLNVTLKSIFETKYKVESFNVSTGKLNPINLYGKIINQFHSLFRYFKALFFLKKIQKENDEIVAFVFVSPASKFGHVRDSILLKYFVKNSIKKYAFIHNGNFDNLFKDKRLKYFSNSFISNVYKIIVLSEGLKYRLVNHIDSKKITVIENTIHPDIVFSDLDFHEKQKEISGFSTLELLYVSNMNPTKGYFDLVNAVKLLVQSNFGYNINLNLVGEWLSQNQLNEFNSFLLKNNLHKNVTIYGRISDRKILKEIYKNSHIFCLPTYFPQEAQPLCIIEALNAGMPVISTNHASIPEYVFNGINGFIVKKKNPLEIANSIKNIMENSLFLKLSHAARLTFKNRFSPEIYTKNIFNCLVDK